MKSHRDSKVKTKNCAIYGSLLILVYSVSNTMDPIRGGLSFDEEVTQSRGHLAQCKPPRAQAAMSLSQANNVLLMRVCVKKMSIELKAGFLILLS